MANVPRDEENVAPVLVVMTDKTYRETPLLVDVERGQQLKLTSTGWRLTDAGERSDGMAMKKGAEGQVGFDILVIGEMDGYASLTPGAKLWPSASADGELQTDTIAGFLAQVTVKRPSRIQVNYTL